MSLLKHMERWEDVKGYEGLYQVSNCGRVKSLNYNHTGKENIISPKKSCRGYLEVGLCKNRKRKFFLIHILVAQAFIPNPDNLQQVNHKDENKENNCVWNLEWCDSKYNSNYGTRNERISKNTTNNPSKSKKVLCVETNIIYPSAHEAARKTGINQANISKCCLGIKKTIGGYHWKYI